MTGRVIPFPARGPFDVTVEREDSAWLVIVRDHGWLHGDRQSAIKDAKRLAEGFGVAIREARR